MQHPLKQKRTYQYFLKYCIYCLLIGQIWTNGMAYFQIFLFQDYEMVEFLSSEENEKEEKTDDKQEKDIRHLADIQSILALSDAFALKFMPILNIHSVHNPEVSTPPPKIS